MKILIYFLVFVLISCTTTRQIKKAEPKPASPQVTEIYSKAQKAFGAGDYAEATKHLKHITSNFPDMLYANESFYLLGQIYKNNDQTKLAYEAYLSVIQSPYFSSKEFSARIRLAEILIEQENYDEALSYLDSVTRTNQVKADLLEHANVLKFNIYQRRQQNIAALETLVILSVLNEGTTSSEAYKMRALDMVNSSLNKDELMQIVGNRSFDFVRSAAFYQLGKVFFEQKEFSRAASYLSSAISVDKGSKYAELANHILEQIQSRSKTNSYNIGAVLPLSGNLAPIGQRSLRGIQLGLGIFDKDRSKFTLSVIDSEANPDVAREAVEKLVVEDNIIALVGSLLSKTAIEVASKANDFDVPSFALSQKNGLQELGPNVFQHALTSKMQVRKIVSTAMNHFNMTRFAILYPEDPYGREFANLFWDEVIAKGGEITAVQSYQTSETDFKAPIRKLVGTYHTEARMDEYNLRLSEWKERNPNSRQQPPADLLPPIIEFDAIFIPDSARALGQIAPMLDYNDVKDVRLLGTNLWNTRVFVERIGKYGPQVLFVDSYSDSQNSQALNQFEQKYQAIFHEKPDPLAIQSYEAAKILRNLIEDGAKSRTALQRQLVDLRNFVGVTGELNMSEDREINKTISLFSVQAGKILPAELPKP